MTEERNMKWKTLAGSLVLVSGSLSAGERVDQMIDAAAAGEVAVDVVRGAVTVVGWDEPAVRVDGTRDDKSVEFVFVREGDLVRIEDRLESRVGRGEGTRITVSVPRASRVRANHVSADFSLRDVDGGVRARTVSGGVYVAAGGGDLSIATVSGDITARHVGGEADFDSVSGDVEADVSTDRLEAESVSGDIAVRNGGVLRRGRLAAVSGDLTLTTALAVDGEVEIESTSGDIKVSLAGAVHARITAATHSGDIVNSLSEAKVVRGRGPGEQLQTTIGDGGGLIQVNALSGDIEIRAD